MRNHDTPPTRSVTGAPYYVPTPPSSPNPAAQHLDGWFAYPPKPIPDIEQVHFKRAPKGLRDVEEFTNEFMEQSAAFREWMGEIKESRESLGRELRDRKMSYLKECRRISVEGPGVASRAAAQVRAREIEKLATLTKEDVEKDRVLLAELHRTYDAFVNLESTQNHASARRRAEVMLESQRQQRPRELSRVERMFGSDGSRPDDQTLSKDTHIYFLGSPLKLYNIPFDQAVATGIEKIGTSATPQLQPLSTTPQSKSPQELVLPGTYIPAEPPINLTQDPNIPDWFALYRLRTPGEDLETGWKKLLNSIVNLEYTIEERDEQKTPEKPKWDKKWHEPSPLWPYPHRREHGGWWKCRSGLNAPTAEALCILCHKDDFSSRPRNTAQKPDPKEKLKTIMDAVTEAMGVVAKRDKDAAMAMLRAAAEDTG
ncbi:hypothetical protein F5Y13DRAFT_170241 [Hypoxylon sp. FL1857]|nr:hypothetical protein F5Y13DRAFT_170241 [Hypoxylon sp. FL1857]